MRICVLTQPARTGEEDPCAFHLGGRRLCVALILERWTDGGSRYFEVCVDDGRRFVLRHDPAAYCWELAAVYAATRQRVASRKQPAALAKAAP